MGTILKPTQKYRRISAADEIAEELSRRVIGGEWTPDSPLPSLRQLAIDFGVSSLTIREAIKSLQVRGLVESRHGSGTYVLPGTPEESIVPWMIRPVDADEFLELNEARQLIEGQIVMLATERRTEHDLDILEGVLVTMESARTDAAMYLDADLEFHIALAESARNRILLRTMLAIRAPLRRLMASRAVEDLAHNGHLDRAIADHRRIMHGVELGDSRSAVRALKRITHRAETYLHTLSQDGPTDRLHAPVDRDAGLVEDH